MNDPERRSGRTGQVFRPGPPLVGPESEFRPCTRSTPCGWTGSTAWRRWGKRVLDVGCGGGILADAMARKGAEVLGIDLATKSLKVAQLHALEAQTPGVTYREVSAEALAAEQAGPVSTW
jgi:2-polyprenyl-6-hydroxyphenyl methylase/3-demethylubiquinone-9 3-methyltransferase